MSTLEVEFVALSECLVSPGYSLSMRGNAAPGVHYNLSGTGTMLVGDHAPIPLAPHTLIIVPPESAFQIEARTEPGDVKKLHFVDGRTQQVGQRVRRYVAGGGQPQIVLICGFFRASYSGSVDLFGSQFAPIVEQFRAGDLVEQQLQAAVAELVAQEIGANAMSATLLKQVILILLRRSLTSVGLWVERFSLLRDPRIARAFSEMVARPGARHTVETLARTAGLSRSMFTSRFAEVVGHSPMLVLRELRMKQAARQLALSADSIEQVAVDAGYDSRSSFARAFRKAHGRDPSDVRRKR